MPIEKQQRNALTLCLSLSVVWGLGYILIPLCQKSGATSSFLCFVRFFLSTIIYGIIFAKKIKIDKKSAPLGLLAGGLLALSFILQAIGQETTTPSNSAFLSSMATVFLPFLSWQFFKKKPSALVYVSLVAYLIGVTILSFDGGKISFKLGDILTLGSAVAFAFHYIVITYAIKRANVQTLNFIQLGTAGLLLGGYFMLFDLSKQVIIPIAWGEFVVPMACLILLSTVYAYSVQTSAQRVLPPYQVSVILSLENIFGAAFSIIFGFEAFKINIPIGGAFMFCAVLLSSLAPSIQRRKQAHVKIQTLWQTKPEISTKPEIPNTPKKTDFDEHKQANL